MSSNPPNTTNINGNNNIVGNNNTIIQPLPDPMGHRAACQALPPPQPFIDREKERDALSKALLAGDVRLICGMGGVGKTALAQRIVQDLADAGKFPEGILWLPLEGNPAPETVAVWVLAAFGLKPEGNPLIQMAQTLNHYRPLLILDNAEAALDTADTILAHRSKAAVLVTSRNVKAGLDVIPGSPDDLSPLEDPDAVELLRSRMAGSPLDDAQAGELNRLVGGLPLALILAAGFITKTLRRDPHPLTTYLNLLRKSPLTALTMGDRRERSVQIAFDLSWDRLNPTEQHAMMALATLPGESAALPALAAALEMEPQSLQSILWILGDYSLIIQTEERWRLHPLLKLYAGEKTHTAEATLLRERLERYYLDYAIQGNTNNKYGEHLDAEHDNVLGAMIWAWEKQDWSKIISFAEAIDFYLQLRGYNTMRLECAHWRWEAAKKLQNPLEIANALQNLGAVHMRRAEYTMARRWYEEALPVYQAIGDLLGEANALKSLGNTHRMLVEYASAREQYEKALIIYQAIGDRQGEATALKSLGNVHRMRAEYVSAREQYEKALIIYQAIGDRLGKANILFRLGNIHRILTKYASAKDQYEEALTIYRAIGSRLGEANALKGLGNVHKMLAEYEAARERYMEALTIYQSIGDRQGEANALHRLGDVHRMLDEYKAARERYAEALTMYQAIGNREGEANIIHSFGEIHLNQNEYEEARRDLTTALSLHQTIQNRIGIANSLRELGDVARCQQQWDDAAQLYKQSLNICHEIGERCGEAVCIAMQGRLAAAQGNNESARQLFNEALAIYQEIGLKKEVTEVQGWLAEITTSKQE